MLKQSLAEMYRKQHCFADASSLYKEVIRNFEQTNKSVVQGIKLNLALCMYYNKEYETAYSVCCKHREVEVDKDNAAICIGIETLTSVLSMVLFKHKKVHGNMMSMQNQLLQNSWRKIMYTTQNLL